MSTEQLVKALKNPELRSKIGLDHPSGKAFEELTTEEMLEIQGAGDVQPHITPSSYPCALGASALMTMLICPKP